MAKFPFIVWVFWSLMPSDASMRQLVIYLDLILNILCTFACIESSNGKLAGERKERTGRYEQKQG